MSSSTAEIGSIDPNKLDIPLREDDRFFPNQVFLKRLRIAARATWLLCARQPKAPCNLRSEADPRCGPVYLTVIPL